MFQSSRDSTSTSSDAINYLWPRQLTDLQDLYRSQPASNLPTRSLASLTAPGWAGGREDYLE